MHAPSPLSASVLPPERERAAPAPETFPCRHAFDEATFERLLRPHLARALAAARRVCRDQDIARDAVQEALIDLWQAPSLPADPRGWLVRAAVHRALCAARGERRRARRERCACGRRPELSAELDPARLARESEDARVLERALESLPSEQRAVFLLRVRDGLEYAAIADALELPVGTVRSRLSRARRELAALLEARGLLEPTALAC